MRQTRATHFIATKKNGERLQTTSTKRSLADDSVLWGDSLLKNIKSDPILVEMEIFRKFQPNRLVRDSPKS